MRPEGRLQTEHAKYFKYNQCAKRRKRCMYGNYAKQRMYDKYVKHNMCVKYFQFAKYTKIASRLAAAGLLALSQPEC